MKVLISAPYMIKDFEYVEGLLKKYSYEFVWCQSVQERLEEKELLNLLPEYDAIVCGDDRITAKVIDRSSRLKVIVKWGTGIDSIDKNYAETKHVKVKRTPGAFTESVADTTLAYCLHFSRRVIENDRVLKAGIWDKIPCRMMSEFAVGLIGFGDIGQAVAKRLSAFGCSVMFNEIQESKIKIGLDNGYKHVSKEEIFQTADIISLHCDLNQRSHGIFGNKTLPYLRGNQYLINTARGPLVETEALVLALTQGKIIGAGLDVFEQEPINANHPLLKFQNVLTAPHNSNSSLVAWRRVHENSLRMLDEALKGMG